MTHVTIDIDDALLHAASLELGTSSVEETVGAALRLAANDNRGMRDTLDALALAPTEDRMEHWH